MDNPMITSNDMRNLETVGDSYSTESCIFASMNNKRQLSL